MRPLDEQRVLVTGSTDGLGRRVAAPLDFRDLMFARGYDGYTAYARSKLAQVLFTVDGVSGRFFDGTRESAAHAQAYDAGARRRHWEESVRLTRPA